MVLAVPTFLIFGFSTGWGNLWDRVTAYGGGDANVDTIVQACALACTGQSVDAYCSQERTMNFGQDRNVTLNGEFVEDQDSVRGSCQVLANNYSNLGVASCSGLC